MTRSLSQNHILITGGAGYIGSYVNNLLIREGYTTVILDNLSHGKRENLEGGAFIEGDICDAPLLERLFMEYSFSCVIHLAGLINVGESVISPEPYYRTNVLGSVHLLNTMIKHDVKKLIFSSSAAVYGIPSIARIPENHLLNPINPYGMTKMAVERLIQDYSHAYGLQACIFRYFNAAGCDRSNKRSARDTHQHIIPVILKALRDKETTINIFGNDYPTPDGTCIRDYIHVLDIANAHRLGMEALYGAEEKPYCKIYNLGNGDGYSVAEIIAIAEKINGKRGHVKVGERRPGDPPILLSDATKASQELGWQPLFPSIDEIVAD
jgi:UDP-glucose 4-epimerase